MTRWTTPDGGRVDSIVLSGTGRHQDGAWLRVTGSRGNFAGMVRTPAELAQFGIDQADLTEAVPAPRRKKTAPPSGQMQVGDTS